jgi:hypothetical protein
MGDGTPDPGTADPGTPAAGARPKTGIPLFVTLILSALLIYCASAGPVLYLVVLIDRNLWRVEWIMPAYYLVYRPHLDLCYRQEAYFRYLTWFIVKAGAEGGSHAAFKEFWEVQAGYRKPAAPPP